MHYLRFGIILSLFSLIVIATEPDPDRKLTEPPNHGKIVGVKATAYETTGIPNQGVSKFNVHPGVVVGGPNKDGHYQVAMVSKNLPHNPPQNPIKDYHPDATVYGNVDLSTPKNVPVDKMRVWVSKKTYQEEPPMTQENLRKLKTAMIPHTNWERPKAPTPPPVPPRQSSSRKGKASSSNGYRPHPQGPRFQNLPPGPTAQGGRSNHPHLQGASSRPQYPAVQQHASGSRSSHPPRIHNPASNAAASSSRHAASNGYSYQGSQAGNRPGPPHPERPKSPPNRPYPPLARPDASARRPYPPPKPHIPSGVAGSSSKRPGSPSDRSRASSPRAQSPQAIKGKGGSQPSGKKSRSASPQPRSSSKGKKREASPPRKRKTL